MIVRPLPDGRLLAINQTSHALMAAAFCRHWGNADFARPQPHDAALCYNHIACHLGVFAPQHARALR